MNNNFLSNLKNKVEVKRRMKFGWRTLRHLLLLIFAVGIIGVVLMGNRRLLNFEGTPDGWLGYWGGIFGSAIGVTGALLVLREQINVEKIDNTFFHLLNIHNEALDRLRNSKKGDRDIFNRIHKELVDHKENVMSEKNTQFKLSYINDNLEKFIQSIQLMKATLLCLLENQKNQPHMDGEQLSIQSIEEFSDDIIQHSRAIEHNIECIGFIHNIDPFNKLYNSIHNIKYLPIVKMYEPIFKQYEELYSEVLKRNIIMITKGSKDKIVEDILNEYYGEMGSYFRIFHRTVKFINENVMDKDSKSNYIGFIRAMINEHEMIVIFYNAFYSSRGKGLGEQLEYTNFFGEQNEIPTKNSEKAQHFNKELLLWEKDDIKIMHGLQLQIKYVNETRKLERVEQGMLNKIKVIILERACLICNKNKK